MESFKKPENIVTLVNTAAILGASVFFYRKFNGLEQELNKHSEHLTSTIKKVREIQITKKHIGQLANAIKELNMNIMNNRRDLEGMKEVILFQNQQIKEIHEIIEKTNEEETIKHKENNFIRYIQSAPNNFNSYNSYQRSYTPTQSFSQSQNLRNNNYNQQYKPQPQFNPNMMRRNVPKQRPYTQDNFNNQQLRYPQRNQAPMYNPNYNQQVQNQQYIQQQYGEPQNFQKSYDELIDLNYTNNPEYETEDDVDSQIDMIRKARKKNSNIMDDLIN